MPTKKSIEKNIIPISVGALLSLLLTTITLVWGFTSYNTRLSLIEQESNTQKDYLYNFKSEIKSEIANTNEKLDNIYKLLLTK